MRAAGVMKTMDEKSKSAANEGVFNISSERKKGLKPNLKRINTKKLAELSVFTSVAMILSYVEALIPSVGIPGAKLGLANIAVILYFTVLDGGKRLLCHL